MIVANLGHVYLLNFYAESKKCESFFQFGELVKMKVWAILGRKTEIDMVGHGMGGMTIRAAICSGEPLLNVHTCVTIATAHGGSQRARSNNFSGKWFSKLIDLFFSEKAYHDHQANNLEFDSEPMKAINTLMNRRLFLERIRELFQISQATEKNVSPHSILKNKGVETLYQEKVREFTIEGAKDILQDPRTIHAIIEILLNGQLFPLDLNDGHVIQKV